MSVDADAQKWSSRIHDEFYGSLQLKNNNSNELLIFILEIVWDASKTLNSERIRKSNLKPLKTV